ncbi:MAG: 2-amino-4-hydroxy-6-hydroxymethyldihydropteridine diphosphokinase [Bacteroidota bacterium]
MDSVFSTYLQLGSNVGDRAANLQMARTELEARAGRILQCSQLYETAAWGITDQASFYNQVLQLSTSLTARELLNCVLEIEEWMGRVREYKWGPRLIDIDILFYENLILRETGLQIPHPEIANRRFVLLPLCEIAPHFRHPETGQTIEEILQKTEDQQAVCRLD